MLFLQTFGGLSLESESRPLLGAAGQRRPLAILAVVAAAGERGVARETLQSLFWQDSDADHARGALKQALYSLRRDLREPEITLGTSEIRLNRAVITSDVAAFRSAVAAKAPETAVRLYGGPFLQGVQLRGLDEFERWADRERDVLAGQYRLAVETLARAAAAAGDPSSSAKWWGRLAAEDPHASRIAIAYMQALVAAGEREAAIRHAEIHSRLVTEELGAEPGVEVASLAAHLRTASPGKSVWVDAPNGAGAAADAPPDAPSSGRPRQSVPPSRFQQTRRLQFVAAGAVLLTVSIVAASMALRGETVSPVPEREKRVVVIPFDNRTGDAALDALGSMTSDWIVDGLSRAAIIPVVDPATSAVAWKATRSKPDRKADPFRGMAEATGATTVVSGSIYRKGDSVEFRGRISDVATGKVVASMEPVNVSRLQAAQGVDVVRERILGVLAQEFDARLSQIALPGSKPPSFEAYKQFVTGVDLLTSGNLYAVDLGNKVSGDAIPYFRRAFALDTSFTTALIWTMLGYDNAGRMKELESLLDSVAPRRSRLIPIDRYAFDYFRARSAGDTPGALRAAKAASDLAPHSVWSWNAASMLFPLNRPREALKYIDRIEPNRGWMTRPGWEGYWYFAAQARHMTGDLQGTWNVLQQARSKFPQNAAIAAAYARALVLRRESGKAAPIVREILQSDDNWRTFYAYSILADLQRHNLDIEAARVFDQIVPWFQAKGKSATEFDRRDYGRVLFAMERWDSASRVFSRIVSDFPKSGFRLMSVGHIAVLAAMRGDSALAVRTLEAFPKTAETWRGEKAYWQARVAAELAHRDRAVAFLQTAFDEGYPRVSLAHSVWHDFPRLQGYPRFEALVASDR